MDPRVEKLARVLISYSLNLKKGQTLKIVGEVAALPLIKAAFKEAVKVGALPYTMIKVPDNEETMLKLGTDAQLTHIPAHAKLEVNKIDAYLGIWGSDNTRYMSGIDPKRQAVHRMAVKSLMQRFHKRAAAGLLSWCGTQFPTLADAQEADMSLADYEDFVYRSGHIHAADPVKHWKKVRKEQARLCKILNKVDRIHVRAEGTDLKLRVEGRTPVGNFDVAVIAPETRAPNDG